MSEPPSLPAHHAKEFSRLARVLPHMFARWRLPSDLEALAELPDGRIRIDALTGAVNHESAGSVALAIAGEMRSGLESRLESQGIPRVTLREATVTVDIDTAAVRTDRKRIVHFDFRIACRLATDAEEFLGSQEEDHVWHEREG